MSGYRAGPPPSPRATRGHLLDVFERRHPRRYPPGSTAHGTPARPVATIPLRAGRTSVRPPRSAWQSGAAAYGAPRLRSEVRSGAPDADLRRKGDDAMYNTSWSARTAHPLRTRPSQAAAGLARSLGLGAARCHCVHAPRPGMAAAGGRGHRRPRRRPGPGRGERPERRRDGHREVRRGPGGHGPRGTGQPRRRDPEHGGRGRGRPDRRGQQGDAPGAISAAFPTQSPMARTAPCWWSRRLARRRGRGRNRALGLLRGVHGCPWNRSPARAPRTCVGVGEAAGRAECARVAQARHGGCSWATLSIVPGQDGAPMLLLITGLPGTGKSTMASGRPFWVTTGP